MCDPGNTFLLATRQLPEFVCTSCHRWIYRKSVRKFALKDYDQSNAVIRCVLSDSNRHPMEVVIVAGEYSLHEHVTEFDIISSDSESDDNCSTRNVTETAQDVDCDLSGMHSWPMSCPLLDNSHVTKSVTKVYQYICTTCHNYLCR